MLAEPHCYTRRCKHLRGVEQPDGTELTERVVCVAYPDGIPDRIAYGDPETMEVADLHLEVQPDQVGEKVFEESEEE